jgi:intein/homing endonuclease
MMDSKTNKQGKKKLKDIPMFKKHFDTQQLRYNFHRIPHDAHVVITEKLHGCVDYSTLVDTLEYGTIKIGKLVDEKLPVHIKSLNLETKEIEYAPVSNHYLLKNDGEWYEIELEDGRTIIITGNNPVYLPNLNCYRRADELTVDDFVLVD